MSTFDERVLARREKRAAAESPTLPEKKPVKKERMPLGDHHALVRMLSVIFGFALIYAATLRWLLIPLIVGVILLIVGLRIVRLGARIGAWLRGR